MDLTAAKRIAEIEAGRSSDGVRLTTLEASNRATAIINTAGDATYSAAQLAGGLIERDPNGLARTDTTDTAAAIIAACALLADGDSRLCYLFNASDGVGETIALAGGTGVTVKNAGALLALGSTGILLMRRTAADSLAVYLVGV